MTTPISINIEKNKSFKQQEAILSPNSLIKQYRFDDAQQQAIYRDSCQHILNDISSVKDLVQDLKGISNIYYPSSSSLKVFKVENNENNELSDSVAQLLDEKLVSCIRHLDNLSTRVSDTSSKVLVTGDLNSGKSTLVNALLKQEILPVDQQPCTSIFCEVLSSSEAETPVVHAIQDVHDYDKDNNNTYHNLELRHLYKVLTADNEEEQHGYKMLKIYSSRDKDLITEESLLHNGVIDIALIDSPGLNTDSVKTTAVFAREEEIDVVVFVVSAENHFTLSGKEFLWNAAHEKTHIFIVVNRFDNIRDKGRCKRLILEQIKQLSPQTYEQADDLVHFVSAGHQVDTPDFIKLEQRLRSFILTNRTQSKLLPAKNYLSNVLRDLYFITTVNESKSLENVEASVRDLETNFLPGYSSLIKVQKNVQRDIQALKSNTMKRIESHVSKSLHQSTSDEELDHCIQSIQYPGLLLTWQYAQDIADSLSARLEDSLDTVENQASQETVNCTKEMNNITREQLKECSEVDITTKVHDDILKNSSNKNHRPIHVKVEARDLLLNRKVVNDKKVAMSGLATVSAATVLFKAINLKDLAWSIISRYINPLEDTTAGLPPRRFVTITLTTVGILSVGWTAYSFISVIPQALQANLKHKFQTVVENEKFAQNQTHRITQGTENILEAKQTEILYRLKEVITRKEAEISKLEESVFHSKSTLNHFKTLVSKSNTLLVKVEESLVVVSPPSPSSSLSSI